jgi:predicted small integral membrane protein
MDLAWMGWTTPTAIFFASIALALISMMVWEYVSPGGHTRVGILRFETTRGDRLFISLLGSAFIHIGWLWGLDIDLWWASALSVLYAFFVFRFV